MFFFFFTARAGLFHLQPPRRQQPHDSFRIPAAAMQWHPAVGDDRGAAVPNALQTGSAHQEIHKDCCPVSIVPPIPQQCGMGGSHWLLLLLVQTYYSVQPVGWDVLYGNTAPSSGKSLNYIYFCGYKSESKWTVCLCAAVKHRGTSTVSLRS